jgi:hypothetical protein
MDHDFYNLDFGKNAWNFGQDVIETYNSYGLSFKFYSRFADMLEFFVENIDTKNSWQPMVQVVRMVMDAVYILDVGEVENWQWFTCALYKKWPTGKTPEKVIKAITQRDHRRPPKPPSYHTAPRGYCRFCGQPILREDGTINKRMHWHPECAKQYNLIYDLTKQRKAVFARDRGVCHICGTVDERLHGNWDMDHLVPLSESRGRIEAWHLNNIGTKCVACHREKSAEETKRRAKRRRENNV